MADGFVHTVHKDEGWVNTIEGGDDSMTGMAARMTPWPQEEPQRKRAASNM